MPSPSESAPPCRITLIEMNPAAPSFDAEITAVPVDTAVTIPADDTVAIEAFVVMYVWPEEAAVTFWLGAPLFTAVTVSGTVAPTVPSVVTGALTVSDCGIGVVLPSGDVGVKTRNLIGVDVEQRPIRRSASARLRCTSRAPVRVRIQPAHS